MCCTLFNIMSHSITTSVRMSEDLRLRLERRAYETGKGKNWVVNEALRQYLIASDQISITDEARRQSILASNIKHESGDFVEAVDFEDWK